MRVEEMRFRGNTAVMKAIIGLLLLVALQTPVIGYAQSQSAPLASLKVTSSAFSDGGKIAKKYTCDSSNVSPPLRIENPPKAVKTLALIVDDPDAPGRTWTHWLLWNIDPKTTEIRENSVPQNAVQGTSDFGSAKYGGPCPPRARTDIISGFTHSIPIFHYQARQQKARWKKRWLVTS